jgi:hypothetical protein
MVPPEPMRTGARRALGPAQVVNPHSVLGDQEVARSGKR